MISRPTRTASFLVLASAIALASGARAATIEVADGLVEVAQDGQCSLIEALENANDDATHADCTAGDEGLDAVVLAAGAVYTLSEVHNEADSWPVGPNGLPRITTPIVVQGHGATIERSSKSDTPEFRLLYVEQPGDLTLEELTLRNGRTSGPPNDFEYGGAIANSGTLSVARALIENNSALGSGGGGIYTEGQAFIHESVVRDNLGGGIDAEFGHATISHSTVSGNGVSCVQGSLTLVNSTVTGSPGFGVFSEQCSLSLRSSTLSGNSRGISVQKQTTTLTNTIIGDSTDKDCEADKSTITFEGVNVIEDGRCDCTGPFCISGDPRLGELSDYGGPTPTHALLVGSIAIDKADDAECPEVDQRGVSRGFDGPGDGSSEDLDGGCDIGAFETESTGFVPSALVVDSEALTSDGNGVFESGESVVVAPAWQNGFTTTQPAAGTASDLTGPTGPTYELVIDNADYGDIESGGTASCQDTGICYQMEVGPAGVERPALHWDATFKETLSDKTPKTWALHLGDSYTDVPRTSPFYHYIETLLHHGVVGEECSEEGGEYCPAQPVLRAVMAKLVLTAEMGAGYAPPPCLEGEESFADVPYWAPLCPWSEELHRRGVVAGCGGGNYCPSASVTRAQMAVFLLRTLLGASYEPPECAGIFEDVPCSSLFADWVEDLHARGITAGCGADPLRFCPAGLITRGAMSAFLSKTFGLMLYGP